MKNEGYKNTILASDGITYELPTAEYFLDADVDVKVAIDMAIKAAKTIGKKFGVVTVEAPAIMINGLIPVKK
jgi:phage baseplate assembly protein gpV